MELNKENLKKLRGLIVFTIAIFVILYNYKILLAGIKLIGKVALPFAIGGAIAFILNVPMNFIERKVFGEAKARKKKWAISFARPVSFLLALCFVIGIIAVVVFVVVPELGRTIMNLGKTLQEVIPKIQVWAIGLFEDNPELVAYISGLEFEWDTILGNVVNFLKNGAGSVLGGTMEAAKSIISGVSTFFIAFVFACYVLFQKERLSVQVRKLMYAFVPEDWTDILIALGSVTHKTFSSFLTGQCVEAVILGCMFFITLSIFNFPYAMLISVLIAFTALIPVFGAFIGCGVGTVLILLVNPMKGLLFVVVFLVLQQREDLSLDSLTE